MSRGVVPCRSPDSFFVIPIILNTPHHSRQTECSTNAAHLNHLNTAGDFLRAPRPPQLLGARISDRLLHTDAMRARFGIAVSIACKECLSWFTPSKRTFEEPSRKASSDYESTLRLAMLALLTGSEALLGLSGHSTQQYLGNTQ